MSSQLAQKLRHIRKVELAYTRTEMAEALGVEVSERDVRCYECGSREPSVSLLQKYAALIGTSPAMLLNDAFEIRPNTGKW